jgi:hypothetical protein
LQSPFFIRNCEADERKRIKKKGERRKEKGDCEADEPTANKGEIAMRKKETA